MLGMVLGFLGSAFAPAIAGATGIAALASPLLAGSIGTGLGTALETGDIKDGLKAGLGSYVGGSLFGGLAGGAGGAAGGPNAANLAQAQAAGLPAAAAMAPPSRPGGGLFGSGALGEGLSRGLAFSQSPAGIGALMGASLATPAPTVEMGGQPSSSGPGPAEMPAIPRQVRAAPEGYRPDIQGEWDYGISRPYDYSELAQYRDTGVRAYAKGGDVKPINEKTEIVEAVAAIKGQHPQPEAALGKFLAKYGEEALRDLVSSVKSGEFDETRERFASGEKGPVRGPGDGTGVDDKVPANIDGGQDVLLSDGEFVLRKDATDALERKYGGGFLSAVNDAGEKAPDVLQSKVAA